MHSERVAAVSCPDGVEMIWMVDRGWLAAVAAGLVGGGPESSWAVVESRGRKSQRGLVEKIVEATVRSKPAGQTKWTRTMARHKE